MRGRPTPLDLRLADGLSEAQRRALQFATEESERLKSASVRCTESELRAIMAVSDRETMNQQMDELRKLRLLRMVHGRDGLEAVEVFPEGKLIARAMAKERTAIGSRAVEKGLLVILMPIDPKNGSLVDTYKTIRDVAAQHGFTAWRSDMPETSEDIVKDVLAAIDRSELILADLTNERPSVYYEVGYAHGKGLQPSEILLIAREGTTLHFDLHKNRTRFYADQTQLKGQLASAFQHRNANRSP
jgi:hypothetical protein